MSLAVDIGRWSRRHQDPIWTWGVVHQSKLIPAATFDDWAPNISAGEFDPESDPPCRPEDFENGFVQVTLHVWANLRTIKISIHGGDDTVMAKYFESLADALEIYGALDRSPSQVNLREFWGFEFE